MIKACPFCGGKAEVENIGGSTPEYIVICDQCGASSGSFDSRPEAAAAWNARKET